MQLKVLRLLQFGKHEYDDKMDDSWGHPANDPWGSLNMRSNLSSHRTYAPARAVRLLLFVGGCQVCLRCLQDKMTPAAL